MRRGGGVHRPCATAGCSHGKHRAPHCHLHSAACFGRARDHWHGVVAGGQCIDGGGYGGQSVISLGVAARRITIARSVVKCACSDGDNHIGGVVASRGRGSDDIGVEPRLDKAARNKGAACNLKVGGVKVCAGFA